MSVFDQYTMFHSTTRTTPRSGWRIKLIVEILRIAAECGEQVLSSAEVGRVARQVSGRKHASFSDTISTSHISKLTKKVGSDGLEYKIAAERGKHSHNSAVTLHAITPEGRQYSLEHPYKTQATYNTLVFLGLVKNYSPKH